MPVQTKIQTRRDTAANWTSTNPTLAAGEMGFETDTLKFKMGNGSTAWTSLSYVPTVGATGATGATGAAGDTGPTGPGVAVGGTTGQALTKIDGTDYNTQWTDVLLGGTYSTYTPTFTNFTLGNGTINSARYAQVGKTVFCNVSVTLGSTSSVTSTIIISLPVTSVNTTSLYWFPASISRSGTYHLGLVYAQTASTMSLHVQNTASTYSTRNATSSTVPFTWASGDSFAFVMTYQVA